MFLHVFTKTAVLAWPFETLLQDRNDPVTSLYDDLITLMLKRSAGVL